MTPQQVIKNFMEALDTHSFKSSGTSEANKQALAKDILDQAIKASSNFNGIQDLIDSFISDCRSYNEADSSNGWINFLKEKCGIDLDNIDTGAITGSDANITLDSGAVIGTGVEKSKANIVPEYGNYYEAMTDAPQSIDTGTNGWIIKATAGNDTIISGGEDSINAGAGNNFITIKGATATIDVANGNNSIFIDSSVKSVVLLNYDATKNILRGNTSVITLGDAITQTDVKGSGDEIWVEEDTAQTSGDLPGNPTPSKSSRGVVNADSATNASNIILDGNDNYFNTQGTTTYSGNKVIKVDLTKAINPSDPVPVGGFIVSGTDTDANFVSTNTAAKQGSIVGQVASVYPELMSFTFNGLTLNVCDRRYKNKDGSYTVLKTFDSFDDVGTDSSSSDTGNEYEKYIVASIYKWWMKESLNLNYFDYGYSFLDDDATPLVINLHFDKIEGGSNALAAVSYYYSPVSGAATQLDLIINKDYYDDLVNYNDVDGGAENTFVYLDRTIAHEFTHALMAAKDNYFAYLPNFISEGMAEVTHGIDDKRTYSIKQLAKNADSLSSVINLTDEYTGEDYSYAGGYMLLRYLAKQTALDTQGTFVPSEMIAKVSLSSGNATYYVGDTKQNPVATTTEAKYSVGAATNYVYTPNSAFKQNITTNNNAWKIDGLGNNNTLKTGTGADSINVSGSNNSIDAGAGNDEVTNTGNNNNINVGAGSNSVTITSGMENTILTGDSGTNKIFFDWQAVNNTLVGGNGIDLATVAGNENVLLLGGGNDSAVITDSENIVYGGAGKDSVEILYSNIGVNYVDLGADDDYLKAGGLLSLFKTGAGKDTISVTGSQNTINSGNDNDTITFAYYYDSIASHNALNFIDAGAGDDSISFTSYNSTIIGGSGNDTMRRIGDQGGNCFAYNAEFGEDVIIGFTENDTILIPNSFTATRDGSIITIKKNNAVRGTIDLKGFTGAVTVINGLIEEDSGGVDGNEIRYTNNSANSTLITGTNYDDTIDNSGNKVTIKALSGEDEIVNTGASVSIDAGAGSDVIGNGGTKVTISGGAEDDYITNVGDSVSIDAGAGHDTIDNSGNNVTIKALGGSDKIVNTGTSVSIDMGDGVNVIANGGTKVTISGGANEDYIANLSDSVSIDSGAGNDYLENEGNEVTIKALNGADEISNTGASVSIDAGAGNDTISNSGANVTISSGADNDYITNLGDSVSIDSGAGNDTISNSGANVI
ncbi:MAG: hypothetical protein IKT98_00670, partial [Selenomonadaceae bacterium]|nr:hypothetical protein [Selenomonadaceae bacterium]